MRWGFVLALHNLLGVAYKTQVGDVGRILLVIGLAVLPVAHEFNYLTGNLWLWMWMAAFAARELAVWYLNGLGSQNLTKRIACINRDIGGSIDSIARHVAPDSNGNLESLSEVDSHSICMSLLARVLDITLNEYPETERSDVRVTLAVPIIRDGADTPRAIRVWCYDRPHDDSRWTEMPLPVGDEAALPGAADAFTSNEVRLIGDIRTTPGVVGVLNRRYSSIVSVPVPAGGPSDTPCAVLNIDAVEPDFFAETVVWERILPLATPVLSAISFVLRLRNPGITFKFGI
jgi:hypothetical protein